MNTFLRDFLSKQMTTEEEKDFITLSDSESASPEPPKPNSFILQEEKFVSATARRCTSAENRRMGPKTIPNLVQFVNRRRRSSSQTANNRIPQSPKLYTIFTTKSPLKASRPSRLGNSQFPRRSLTQMGDNPKLTSPDCMTEKGMLINNELLTSNMKSQMRHSLDMPRLPKFVEQTKEPDFASFDFFGQKMALKIEERRNKKAQVGPSYKSNFAEIDFLPSATERCSPISSQSKPQRNSTTLPDIKTTLTPFSYK